MEYTLQKQKAISISVSYVVPAGQTLYLMNAAGSVTVNGVVIHSSGSIAQPIIIGAGSTVGSSSTTAIGINGYLTNSNGMGGN